MLPASQSAAMADPKFVADNFTRQAQGSPRTSSPAINSEGAAEIKAAREQKVASNIAANFAGLGEHSSRTEISVRLTQANLETVNGKFGGRMSCFLPSQQPKRWPRSWRIAVGTEANQTQTDMHPILIPLTLLLVSNTGISSTPRSSTLPPKARSIYNLGKGELNMQAESIVNELLGEPHLQRTFELLKAQLRQINTPASRRLADKLVQHGYEYDPSVARDIASKVGTDQEYSSSDQGLVQQGCY